MSDMYIKKIAKKKKMKSLLKIYLLGNLVGRSNKQFFFVRTQNGLVRFFFKLDEIEI